MTTNVGKLDRILRAAIGVALLSLAFLSEWPLFDGNGAIMAATAIAVVMLATSATKFCPLYSVVGLNTCREA